MNFCENLIARNSFNFPAFYLVDPSFDLDFPQFVDLLVGGTETVQNLLDQKCFYIDGQRLDHRN